MEDILKQAFLKHSDPEKVEHNKRFFRTGKGEYGEGDKFLGLTLPQMHAIEKEFKDLELPELKKLLHSEYHEHRLTAIMILAGQYKRAKKDPERQEALYKFYLKNTKWVNNWDIVDSSAHKIVGEYLKDKKDRSILYKLADSKSLWDNRIAVIATMPLIKEGDFKDILRLAKRFLTHEHDLIHKAVGWMLREVGKKDIDTLRKFLDKNATKMPRTMLRYSIEKLPEKERQKYLKAK